LVNTGIGRRRLVDDGHGDDRAIGCAIDRPVVDDERGGIGTGNIGGEAWIDRCGAGQGGVAAGRSGRYAVQGAVRPLIADFETADPIRTRRRFPVEPDMNRIAVTGTVVRFSAYPYEVRSDGEAYRLLAIAAIIAILR
jgi:hypothetical protein